jgi:hypothetical protein
MFKIIDDFKDDFICSICHELVVDPKMTECEHYFCCKCIYTWKKKCDDKILTCPLCRKNIIKMKKPGRFFSEMLNNLKIECNLCNEPLTYSNKKSHKDICPKVLIECGHCDIMLERDTFDSVHKLACEYCDKIVMQCKYDKHIKKCDKMIIKCTYCESEDMRSEMLKHEEICPDKLIRCPQCNKKMILSDFPKHLYKKRFSHIESYKHICKSYEDVDHVDISIEEKNSDIECVGEDHLTPVEHPIFNDINNFEIHEWIDAKDVRNIWREAIIINKNHSSVFVRFLGWSEKWNNTVDVMNIAKLHTKTKDWRTNIKIGEKITVTKNQYIRVSQDLNILLHEPSTAKIFIGIVLSIDGPSLIIKLDNHSKVLHTTIYDPMIRKYKS